VVEEQRRRGKGHLHEQERADEDEIHQVRRSGRGRHSCSLRVSGRAAAIEVKRPGEKLDADQIQWRDWWIQEGNGLLGDGDESPGSAGGCQGMGGCVRYKEFACGLNSQCVPLAAANHFGRFSSWEIKGAKKNNQTTRVNDIGKGEDFDERMEEVAQSR